MSEAVKVIVRCRPLNEREKNLNCEVVVTMDRAIMQVQLRKCRSTDNPKKFTFDGVYYVKDNTKMIYDDICFDLVTGVLNGYNGTVFAYGQTGCGKSFTMMGVETPIENKGIIPRAFGHIFDEVALQTSIKYLVRASYLEIYNEEVRDLLSRDSKKRLDVKEHPEKGVYVKDLSIHKVHNVRDLEAVMDLGSKNRSVGATLMNVDSSRSHSIFIIDIERAEMIKGQSKIRAGRLNLVDLAGSERQSKTGSTGDRLKEATKINLSLSALGNVISALVDGKSKHIPYRDSKLTRLLQSSLGGNTKTLMTACISPAEDNYEETLSTLRYANRAKNIKNKPKINEDPKDALLREYQEEIKQLKLLLTGMNVNPSGEPIPVATPEITKEQERKWEIEKEEIKRQYEEKIHSLKTSFGKEKASKKKMEERLLKLQEEKNKQLMTVDEKKESAMAEAVASPEATAEGSAAQQSGKKSGQQDKTKQEKVKKRLQELEGALIGGEKAGDTSLKKKMSERQKVAEQYRTKIVEVRVPHEDDIVIEKIFNNLTEEVYYKNKALEKCKDKLESSRQEVRDLGEEFERDRQDYLDMIRRQEQTIRLFDQLLGTVAPLLRQDCNYYNIDKMKKDSHWDRDAGQWVIPKVSVSKTKLTVVAAAGGEERVSPRASNTRVSGRTNNSTGGEVEINIRRSDSEAREGQYFSELHKSHNNDETSDYFKPKRAQEILNKSSNSNLTPETTKPPSIDLSGAGSNTSISSNATNAAAIHGVDTHIMGNSRRGERLLALPKKNSLQRLSSDRSPEGADGRRRFSLLQPLGSIKPKNF